MTTFPLIEAIDMTEAVIDAEARSVRQRIIKAGMSLNRRYYSDLVVQSATPLFENAQTYRDHPSRGARGERSVADLTGWLEKVEYRDGALWATRRFTANSAGSDAWSLVQEIAAGRAPANLMGASINAVGKGRQGKVDNAEALIVESIDAVLSVDDVSTPAAGGGWRESAPGDLLTLLLSEMTFEEWAAQSTFVDKLKKEWKQLRQDDALKTALAESEATRLALNEAQAHVAELTRLYEAAQLETERARREARLVEVLFGTPLPAAWRDDLREALLAVEPGQWSDIIKRELAKARAANILPRPAVTGADVRTDAPLTEGRGGRLPRPDEDVAAWLARIRGN